MARPREFDIDRATDRAMQVFWGKGYEAAGLPDLLDAMEITRGSLYKAFGDKRRLFLAALRRYDAEGVGAARARLADHRAGPGRGRIAAQLHSVVAAVAERGDRRGCLLCNTAVELAPHDPEIAGLVRDAIRGLEEAFAVALADTPEAAGRLPSWLPPAARALTTSYLGLCVLAKAGLAAADLGRAADVALRQVLDGPSTGNGRGSECSGA